MGPKKEPLSSGRSRKDEPGAKIARIILGNQENPLVVKVNLNCPLDMLLDYVRVQFVKKLDMKLGKDVVRSASIEEETEETSGAGESQVMAKFWVQFHTELSAEGVAIDLIDSADALADCQQDLKRNAVISEVLVPYTTYTLATLATDSAGQVSATPMLVRNGERVAPIVKGGAAPPKKK